MGPCPYICQNKTAYGYCQTTVCTNPEFSGGRYRGYFPLDKTILVGRLREYADWATANSWELPVDLPDVLEQAADIIEHRG